MIEIFSLALVGALLFFVRKKPLGWIVGPIGFAFVLICNVVWGEVSKHEQYTDAEIEKAILWTVDDPKNRNLPVNTDPELRAKIVRAFSDAADQFDQPVMLLVGMGYRESRFRLDEVGDKGKSIGIMQVGTMGRRKCRMYCGEMKTPHEQIMCGGCWLTKIEEWCGTLEGGVTGYACGKCEPPNMRTKRAVKIRLNLQKKLHTVVRGS